MVRVGALHWGRGGAASREHHILEDAELGEVGILPGGSRTEVAAELYFHDWGPWEHDRKRTKKNGSTTTTANSHLVHDYQRFYRLLFIAPDSVGHTYPEALDASLAKPFADELLGGPSASLAAVRSSSTASSTSGVPLLRRLVVPMLSSMAQCDSIATP